MKLSDYLTKKQITSLQFAKQIRVSISSVHKWRAGYRFPRPMMMLRIQKATKNKVTTSDWYMDQAVKKYSVALKRLASR